MIAASELRPGNIVRLIPLGEWHFVNGTNQTAGLVHLAGNGIWNDEEVIAGEHLNVRWMNKCGLEWRSNIHRWVHKETGWRVAVNDNGFQNGLGDGSFMQPYIEYVHQLQNLFHALTGKELKITI